MPLALRDNQLELVMAAAGGLPVERRSEFLERVAAWVRHADVNVAVAAATQDLMQAPRPSVSLRSGDPAEYCQR
jgi:hypothetical protein